jgi:rhodanese-related sulfurtransferase
MGVAQHPADFCPCRNGRRSGGAAKFANLTGNVTACERMVGQLETEIVKQGY